MAEYSELIIDLARKVWGELGPGYSERVYHNAMEVMLRTSGVGYETERIIPIPFKGHVIGNLRADLVVANQLIVELKAIRALKEENKVQAKKYIQLTGLPCTLLINFPQPWGELEFFLVVL
jgi:GxxExxY protein